jgi:hypothetical protein
MMRSCYYHVYFSWVMVWLGILSLEFSQCVAFKFPMKGEEQKLSSYSFPWGGEHGAQCLHGIVRLPTRRMMGAHPSTDEPPELDTSRIPAPPSNDEPELDAPDLSNHKSIMTTDQISVLDRMRVLLYRLFLSSAAMALMIYAGVSFLDGVGMSNEARAQVLGQGALFTAEASALAAIILPSTTSAIGTMDDTEDSPAIRSMAETSLRVAGGVSLLCIAGVTQDPENLLAFIGFGGDFPADAPLAITGPLSLSLAVLAAGKVFEPILEDLRPGKSSFFLDRT